MKNKINASCLVLLALLVKPVNAEINYDYIEIGFSNVKVSELESSNGDFNLNFNEVDGSGISFEASHALNESYFIYADFDFNNFDLNNDTVDFLNNSSSTAMIVGPNVDFNTQLLGIGFHTDGNTQFVVRGGLLRQSIDSDFLKESSVGYDVEVGVRGLLSSNFEWEANLNVYDPDLNKGASGSFGVNASLRYNFNENISTDLTIATREEQTTVGLNFRYSFE